MKKSRAITLALVGTVLLASGAGCGGRPSRTFYDKQGKVVPRTQWKKADGTPNELYDEHGNPVSPDVVNAAYSNTTTSSHRTYRSSGWFWGPSYYTSYGGGYSRGYSSGTRSFSGGGSVSRGGFGSTGGAHASSGG